MKNPKFSIITVSFNSAKTIEKTILSVLNQTFQDFEYIIIDGGSTDGTVSIINKYKDKIAYFVSEKDEGISDAFNKGILVSRGEIIGIVNSDDWYEKNALEIINKLDIENNADVYVGGLNCWNKDLNKKIQKIPNNKYKKTINYSMTNINHPASFIKKSLYEKIGLYNKKYKVAMDYDLFLRAYQKNNKFILTKEILSNMLSGGMSEKMVHLANREVLKISQNKLIGLFWYIRREIKDEIRNIFIKLFGVEKWEKLKEFIKILF